MIVVHVPSLPRGAAIEWQVVAVSSPETGNCELLCPVSCQCKVLQHASNLPT